MTRIRQMIVMSLCLALCSCAPNISRPLPADASGLMQLNAGYALLYDLMSEEAKVAEILKIKHADKQLSQLLQDISAVAKDAVKQLDTYKTEDPSLKMDKTHLPAVEVSSRSYIKNATTVDLLLPGRTRFETLMLLSQFSAMRYGRYIAVSLETADANFARSQWLRELASKLSDFQSRAFEMLEAAQTAKEDQVETLPAETPAKPPATPEDKAKPATTPEDGSPPPDDQKSKPSSN